MNIFQAMRYLMKNPQFMLAVLITSVMFYIISGILFWSTDYFVDVLLVPKANVTILFALTSLTSPISGALAS
jgi:MFS transporter, Spinster family, sphingosine-1-phosphate transporter